MSFSMRNGNPGGATVAVLGAFGLMAEASLYDLARSPIVDKIYAADVNLGRAEAVLAKIPNRRKIKPVVVDLRDTAKAARALKGAQAVLSCAWYEHNLKAMDVALALKAHYADLGGLFHTTLKQLKLDAAFQKLGRVAVLGCGSTPGITNVMAAAMAEDFDALDTVGIYDASYDPTLAEESFLPPFSIRTMMAEYEAPAPIWEHGRLKEVPAHSRAEVMDFKAPIGRVSLGAVIHSEVATLPAYFKKKGVKNLCFKIAYPESVKRQLAVASGIGLGKSDKVKVDGVSVSPRDFLTALAVQNAQTASYVPSGPPKDFEILRVKVTGKKAGAPYEKVRDCEITPIGAIAAGTAAVGFAGSMAAIMALKGSTQFAGGAAAPESALDHALFFDEMRERKIFRMTETAAYPVA
ncbi:MAG: saccharopine dehydrogenase NADP-binding domain-containing protein [Elusimicrobia bacterium]|nr:saccharopine dehydrogenase NADP-binding domain-containing protein [Elusimicrobiota bacterium]